MRHKGVVLASLVVFAAPLLACNIGALTAWGDLVETANGIWAATWTEPEPDWERRVSYRNYPIRCRTERMIP